MLHFKIDDAIATKRGEEIIKLLHLRLDGESRVKTTWGTKTALGLFRTLERLMYETYE